MDNKKSPKGRKRTSKGVIVPPEPSPSDEHYWDCSVCTFRNNAEAFKCSMCDVRKGTSTRKPKINPDIVAAQQAQALTPPPPPTTPTPSSSNISGDEGSVLAEEETESAALATLKSNKKNRETKSTKKKESKKSTNNTIPRLKNVDRNSATYHSVTVNDFTVVITEFKPRVKKEKKPKAPVNSNNTSIEEDRNSSVSFDGSDENSRPNGNSVSSSPLD